MNDVHRRVRRDRAAGPLGQALIVAAALVMLGALAGACGGSPAAPVATSLKDDHDNLGELSPRHRTSSPSWYSANRQGHGARDRVVTSQHRKRIRHEPPCHERARWRPAFFDGRT